MAERQHEHDEDDINDVNDVNDVNTSLEELKGQYETIVASLTACIKGLQSLKKESSISVRKGGVVKSLKRVLDKAEQDAIAAGTSYGTAVLEALEGAE
jgi:predicted transcriptional regulator